MQGTPNTANALLVRNATVVDCSTPHARVFAADVLIEDGRFAAIEERGAGAGDASGAAGARRSGRSGSTPLRKNPGGIAASGADESEGAVANVIDASGLYMLPGLVNGHCHLFSTGDIGYPDIVMAASEYEDASMNADNPFLELAMECAQAELAGGVTTLRCMGDYFWADLALRELSRTADTPRAFEVPAAASAPAAPAPASAPPAAAVLPHIVACGRPITVPSGHGDGPIALIGSTGAEMYGFVDDVAAHNADFVKIFATGGVVDATRKGEPGELKMAPELIAAVCERAHRRGLKVSAHAESTAGVLACLRSGVDFIEHGASLNEEALELFAETGAVLVQTLSPAVGLARYAAEAGLDAVAAYNAQVLYDEMLAGLSSAREAGIPVAIGNDASCAFVTHYAFWQELVWTEKLVGLAREGVLYAATLGNANVLGIASADSPVSAVTPGCPADFCLYEASPCDDLRALESPKLVAVRGTIVEPVCRRFVHIDEKLDRIMDELG